MTDLLLRRKAAAVPLAAVMVIGAVVAVAGARFGEAVFLVSVAIGVGLCALRSPVFAAIAMLATLLLRQAVKPYVPVDVFWLALAVLAVATVLWMDRTENRLRGVDAIGWAMVAYLSWNVFSLFSEHKYAPADELAGTTMALPRFVIFAALLPLAMYLVGRFTFDRTAAVRALLWTVLLMAGYSALTGIMQTHGLSKWVWPKFGVNPEARGWAGRAVGVMDQPVGNGVLLAIGIAIAAQLICRGGEPTWRRWSAVAIALGCGYGIYLTQTRAAWLSGVVVLIIGAILAKGYRRGYVVTLSVLGMTIVAYWSRFTSSDRSAGGVGSAGEVEDRLNTIKTALWAAGERPVDGWGIGRFRPVNTFHHQQWSQDVPWERGYNIVSHQNELGILAELGVVGLVLWVSALALMGRGLWRAYRTLPDHGLTGKPLAVTAITAFAVMLNAGFTVDLRFLDLPTGLVFLIVGVAIGCQQRHALEQRVPAVEPDDRMVVQHG